MWQTILFNPEWQVLRSGWRLMLFAGLVFFAVWFVPQVLVKRFVRPLVSATPLSPSGHDITLDFLVYGLIAAFVLGIMYFMVTVIEHRSMENLGMVWNADFRADLLVGLALGTVLPGGILGVMLAMNWAKITGSFVTPEGISFVPGLIALVLVYICIGFWEEIAFRVYLLPTLAQGWTAGAVNPGLALVLALLATSVPFGLAHLGNPNATPTAALMIAMAGVMLGLGFILTGRPALGIGLHIAGNIFQALLGVAGTQSSFEQTRFFRLEFTGPTLWTGGTYGTEAGLLSLVFVAISMGLMLGYVGLRYGPLSIKADLATVVQQRAQLPSKPQIQITTPTKP
jgi:uncharacterized protein